MKPISRMLIFSMLHLCWLSSFGWAEMVKTESALQSPSQIEDERQHLIDFLDRQEVAHELERYSITKVEAVARINSLTDEEVIEIAGRLDELQTGGYAESAVGFAYVAVMALYIFILFPTSIILCPFSEKSYFDCLGHYNSRFLRGIHGGSDGGGGSGGDVGEYSGKVGSNVGSENLDLQVCRFDCTEDYKFCRDSINEAEDPSKIESCATEQERCSDNCIENVWRGEGGKWKSVDGKWCQKPDTNEWVLCKE